MNDVTHKGASISAPAVLVVLILSFGSIIAQGHQFGVGNTIEYVAWIMEYQSGGTFLVNDWYLSTPMLHPNIVIPLGWLSHVMSLDWSFLLAHVLTRIVLCVGVFLLAYGMFRRYDIAFLSIVAVVLFPRISLGGHFAHAAHFEANFVGFALAVLFLSLFIQGRRSRRWDIGAFIVLGLLYNVHLFIGLHLTGMVVLYYLFVNERRGEIVRRFPLAVLVGSPALVSTAATYFTQSHVIPGSAVAEILAFRHPHHHSPLSWNPLTIAEFTYYTMFWLVLHYRISSRGKTLERVVFIYVVITCIVHLVFVEFIPVGFIAYLQGFRQTVLFTVFTSLYLAAFAVELIRRRHPLLILLAVLLILTFRVPIVFIPLSMLSLIVYYIVHREKGRLEEQHTITMSRSKVVPFLMAVLVVTVLLLFLAARGTFNPVFEKAGRRHHFKRTPASPDEHYNALCDWIREHTPAGAVFIIPPNLEGFRVRARRAIVVDYKAMTFTNEEIWRWFERISRVGRLLAASGIQGDVAPGDEEYASVALRNLHRIRFTAPVKEMLATGYSSHTAATIQSLARRYQAGYVVVPAGGRSYPFSVVYENGGYTLYTIPSKIWGQT